jgi:maltooligosyltrehalose trehalohydrolase
VWAPQSQLVDLVVDGRTVSMRRAGNGWWECDEKPLAGMRYGFSLDGRPALPDPRSHSQPGGVHGRSEVVDHDEFEWSDDAWEGIELGGSVLYELHIGTFTPAGTFDAVIDHLAHLTDLGVDAIELMPVVEFPGKRGWGYDGVDLFAPHHAYGGPGGLKRLVDACHAHDLGVILDVVYNHLGPDGNYLAQFGPYFSDRHQTHWGPGVNFDGPDSHEVRRFALDNAAMWFSDYHVDGLRLDAVHAISDDSPTHILEAMAIETGRLSERVDRPLSLIAESDENDPRYVRDRDCGGMGLDGVWADEWHHALHALFTGERDGYYEDFGTFEAMATALRQAWVYTGRFSPHRGRVHGGSPEGLEGDRFVVFTQNHDQVGNRAAGERIGSLMSEGRVRVAAALLLTGPFTPMLFQGEEWGATTPFLYFTDHEDPDLGEAVSEGRRQEFAHFGWDSEQVPDPQAEETFVSSKLDWQEADSQDRSGLLQWHRELIELRKTRPELGDSSRRTTSVEADGDLGTIVVQRGPTRVVANIGAGEAVFEVDTGSRLLLASAPAVGQESGQLRLPPDSVAIVSPS